MLALDTFNEIAIPDYLKKTFFIEGIIAVENALKLLLIGKLEKFIKRNSK